MKTQWLILVLGLAAATFATACGGTDDEPTWVNSGDESEDPCATEPNLDEKQPHMGTAITPGLEEQGGFWGDGYHEEDEELDHP